MATNNDEQMNEEMLALIDQVGFGELEHLKSAGYGHVVPKVFALFRAVPVEQVEAAAALVLRFLATNRNIDLPKVQRLVRLLELMEVEVFEGMAGFGPTAQA